MWKRALFAGIVIWTVGTAAIRLAGQRFLQPGHAAQTLALYLLSFLLMALVVPRICRRLGVDRDLWPKAATLLILPTLILDPLACVFFTALYPNLDPASAGAFGGWMLMCCGGGIAGVWRKA